MRSTTPITLVLAAVIAGAFLIPVQPLYASSGSMSPTIESGDLYFVHEGESVATGDIVAFRPASGEQLVTHRVVGERAEGYVTKGDANPSTDQEAGLPIVPRSAVLGTVVEVNGRPITVGGVGPIAAQLTAHLQSLFRIGALLALIGLVWSARGRDRSVPERSVVSIGDVVNPLFIGSLVVCLFFVFWGASTHDLNYVASAGAVTAAHTVPVGETVTRQVSIDTHSMPFTTVLVEAEGVRVLERTATATGLSLLVEVPGQASTGLYQASVHVATYPATLPRGAIEWLHGIHWMAAAAGTTAPILAPIYALYLCFFDGGMPLRGPTSRWLKRMRWT